MIVKLTNGVSWGKKYVVTSADATLGKVEFDFVGNTENAPSYELAFNVMIVRSNIVLNDAKVTVDGNKITVETNSTSYVLTSDDVIHIIANRTE